ncbi:DUF6452 family protein [Moheibacter stercoris]|uniref:DUF1735 domain-containing protein n=1 Tax=Moheibacter stercoris TaxID=1628251 RepID=A0ABV2LVR1_9FLAO
MKKGILFLGIAIASIFAISCEEDDVCVGEGTPYLTVVFRNNLNQTNFKDSLTIIAANNINFENAVEVLPKTFTDSVKLPLGGLESSATYFQIKRRSNTENDILTVNYSPKSSYVSKACGFRLTYENLNYQSTGFYIENIIPSESTILENEATTNLYIALSN